MTDRLPRYRTGTDALDASITQLLDELGVTRNRDVIFELFAAVVRLTNDGADRLNLKIVSAALKEMREAFRVFEPYSRVPKVTIFGSARTAPDDPVYAQARDSAHQLAETGWMVVTGAGPGIMAAGLEGAGRYKSFGINIRLPHEQGANEFIAADPKLVSMKYFFTRKLMLIKDSDGFVVLPGGVGTLDETFELLTLLQTGKADPAPIVLLDMPGGTFWHGWQRFMTEEVLSRRLISPEDDAFYSITDDVEEANSIIVGFYKNYHSRRFIKNLLHIRLKDAPTDAEVERLNEEFADMLLPGKKMSVVPTTDIETEEDDVPHLARLAVPFDRFRHGRLRQMIDVLNALESAKGEEPTPEHQPSH